MLINSFWTKRLKHRGGKKRRWHTAFLKSINSCLFKRTVQWTDGLQEILQQLSMSVCACTSHLIAGTPAEECLTQVWTDSVACCCGKVHVFCIYARLQTFDRLGCKLSCLWKRSHLPEWQNTCQNMSKRYLHASYLSGCAYSRLQPPHEALQFFWFHWHQCYTLVNVCFSSGGNCKTLYKHLLTSDSKEKPKGALIQNLKVALSIVLLSNRLLPSQPCSR